MHQAWRVLILKPALESVMVVPKDIRGKQSSRPYLIGLCLSTQHFFRLAVFAYGIME